MLFLFLRVYFNFHWFQRFRQSWTLWPKPNRFQHILKAPRKNQQTQYLNKEYVVKTQVEKSDSHAKDSDFLGSLKMHDSENLLFRQLRNMLLGLQTLLYYWYELCIDDVQINKCYVQIFKPELSNSVTTMLTLRFCER